MSERDIISIQLINLFENNTPDFRRSVVVLNLSAKYTLLDVFIILEDTKLVHICSRQ